MRGTPHRNLPIEQVLEAVLVATLGALDLAGTCVDRGLLVPTDASTDTPVDITYVDSFARAGVLALDPGVYLELSDGSAYTLTLTSYHRPDTTTHPQTR